jgi:hypothetical protein
MSKPKLNQQLSSTEFEVRLHSYPVIQNPPTHTNSPTQTLHIPHASVLWFSLMPQFSCLSFLVFSHASCLMPHASCLSFLVFSHASCLMPQFSRFLSCLMPHASCLSFLVFSHASCLMPHASVFSFS